MKYLIKWVWITAFVVLFYACEKKNNNTILKFNEYSLSIINEKILQFEKMKPIEEDGVYCPILIACLLDDSIYYDDSQMRVIRDTSYKGRYSAANILNQNNRDVNIFRTIVWGNSAADNHILLVNGEKMTFIDMSQSFEQVIKELLKYFKTNPNVDKRLLPLYTEKITYWFLRNHWRDERGEWYDWFNEQDSVSREYYKFQYPKQNN